MKKSLNVKLDELSKIGVLRQFTNEERMAEYNTYPDEFKAEAIAEANQYIAKGMVCNEFRLLDGSVESVIQWNYPSEFIKNCYAWFVLGK